MILDTLNVALQAFERRTGWQIKPQGACKGESCVPLAPQTVRDGVVDVRAIAERLGMPLAHDAAHGLWSLGPESGGRSLTTATAPELVLPDRNGEEFALSAVRGRKVLLLAWASW